MATATLRCCMIQHHVFLHKLYKSKSTEETNKLLIAASKKLLEILLNITYRAAFGSIRFDKAQYTELKRIKKVKTLATFKDSAELDKLLKNPKSNILAKVKEAAPCLSIILKSVFVKYQNSHVE